MMEYKTGQFDFVETDSTSEKEDVSLINEKLQELKNANFNLNTTSQDELRNVEKEISSLRSEIQKLNAAKNQAVVTLEEQKITALQSQQAYVNKNSISNDVRAKFNTEISKLLIEINDGEEQTEKLNADIQTLTAEITDLRLIIVSQEKKIIEKNTKRVVNESLMAQMQQEIMALETRQAMEEFKVEELQKAIQHKDNNFETTRKEYEQKLLLLSRALDDKEVSLRKSEKYLIDVQNEARTSVQELEADLQQLQQHAEAAQITSENMISKLSSSIMDKAAEITELNSSKQATIVKFDWIVSEKMQEITELKLDLESHEVKEKAQESRIDELEQQLTAAQTNYDNRIAELSGRITDKAAEITELNSSKQAAIVKFNWFINEKMQEIAELKLDLESHESKEKLQESRIDELEQQVTAAQTNYENKISELSNSATDKDVAMAEMKLALESHELKEKSQESRINELEQQFEATQTNYENKMTQLSRSMTDKDTAITELNSTNRAATERFTSFKNEKLQAIAELKLDLENRIMKEKSQELRIIELGEQLEMVQTNSENRFSQFGRTITDKDEVIVELMRDLEIQNSKERALETRIHDLKQQVEAMQKNSESKISQLGKGLNDKDTAIAELKRDLSNQQLKEKSQEFRILDLQQQAETMQKTSENRISQLSRSTTEKDIAIAELTRDLESQSNIERALEARIHDLQRQSETKQKNLENRIFQLGRNITDKDAAIAELNMEHKTVIDRFGNFKNEKRHEIEELKSEITRLECERARLHDENLLIAKNKYSIEQVEIEVQKVERRSQQLQFVERRSQQLQFYAHTLNQEKTEVVQTAKQLVQELQTARNNNPLRDYLAATSRELSKTEIQLKKTPTISYERGYLENYLGQLIEQRDFLKSVIENSLRQMDRQTNSLMKIANNDKLFPSPPVPPKV